MRRKPPARAGRVHVMSRLCDSCIFRPGRFELRPGRLEGLVQAACEADSCIPCHETTYGADPRGEAVCRGFYERHRTAPLQIAERLGLITFQSPLPKS